MRLPHNDHYWASNRPPLHFQCRSTSRGIYPTEMKVRRIAAGDRPDNSQLPAALEGFGTHPLTNGSFWKMSRPMVERAKQYEILDEIIAYTGELFGLKTLEDLIF